MFTSSHVRESLLESLIHRQDVRDALRQTLNGEPCTVTVLLDDAVVELRCSPCRDEGGVIVGGVGIAADVSLHHERIDEHVSLYQAVSALLTGAAILDDALLPLLELLCAFLRWDLGVFWTTDAANDALRCTCFYHAPLVMATHFEMITRELPIMRGESMLGRVWAQGTPEWQTEITSDPAFRRSLAARSDGLNSGCAVPVLAGNTVRAVMEFYSRYASLPDRSKQTTLHAVATQVGQFLLRLDAERILREKEGYLNDLLAHVPVMLFELDPAGQITLFEGRALQDLGRMPGEAVGHSVFEMYRDYPEILTFMSRALAGETFTAIMRLGAMVFEVHFTPQHVSGQIVGVRGLATDITARVDASGARARYG